MADQKLSDLDSNTPVRADLIYHVDDPAGTPVSKKATAGEIADLVNVDDTTIEMGGSGLQVKDGGTTLAKMADMATASLIGRDTAGTGVPEVLSAADSRALLAQAFNKLDATAAPDADNDVDEGFGAGSFWIDVTADKAYVCLDPSDGAAVWREIGASGGGGGGGAPVQKLDSGYWFTNATQRYDNSDVYNIFSKDTLTFLPISIPNDIKIDRVAIHITTLNSGTTMRMGIYSGDENPETLVADFGDMTVLSAGEQEKTFTEITVSAGFYWICVGIPNTSGIVGQWKSIGETGALHGRVGFRNNAGTSFANAASRGNTNAVDYGYTSGALPASPAATTYNGFPPPIVGFKVSDLP